jgi:adenine-specific DNA-methyltransferase
MGRRYIGIEMGEHAQTHDVPRLRRVIEGEQGGISKSQNWQGGGGFRFYKLGPKVFDEDGRIREGIGFLTLAAHVWFSETHKPWRGRKKAPLLGVHETGAIALLYNGVLGDRSVGGGNVLTRKTLAIIREGLPEGFDLPLTVYGERSALGDATLEAENIVFKQTPYDVKARR